MLVFFANTNFSTQMTKKITMSVVRDTSTYNDNPGQAISVLLQLYPDSGTALKENLTARLTVFA